MATRDSNKPLDVLTVKRHKEGVLVDVAPHQGLQCVLLFISMLIERRKQGREVYISLRGELLKEVAAWVRGYERFWNEHLDQFQQHFKDKQKKEKK